MRCGLTALVLAAAVLFGGGSRSGFLGDVAVQLLAVPLLVLGARDWIVRMTRDKAWRADHLFLNLALIATIFVMLLQLIQWPTGVGDPAGSIGSHGLLSARPAASWAAIASSIPFFAVFLETSRLGQQERAKLAMLIVALGGLSLLIGFLQVSQGSESGLRFYTITNPSEAVGFFANRNHFAALLYIALILTAVSLAGFGGMAFQPVALNTRRALGLILTAILLIAILSGLALARSRAGMALSLVATAGIFALHWSVARGAGRNIKSSTNSTRHLLIATAAFGLVFAIQFGMQRAMSRFEVDPFSDLRTSLSPATAKLALQHLPYGTGLGSFEQTYSVSEADTDLFSGYANRAHNDWAEFLLETGLPGAIAGGLFLIWLAGRIVWSWSGPPHKRDTHVVMLERGVSLIVILLLVHSIVDYPLRTTALSSIFAFAAALLIAPPAFEPSPLPGSTAPG